MTSADVPEVGVIYTIEYVGIQEFGDGVESSAIAHGHLIYTLSRVVGGVAWVMGCVSLVDWLQERKEEIENNT